jgi:hypothetical protein
MTIFVSFSNPQRPETMSETNSPIHPDGIYRMLKPGEMIQQKDGVYDAINDQWVYVYEDRPMYGEPMIRIAGTPYDPAKYPPIRRFNRPEKEL